MDQIDLMNHSSLPADQNRKPLTIAVGQFSSVEDTDTNLETIDRLTYDAAKSGADLVVFPEASSFSWRAESELISKVAAEHGERFVKTSREIAKRHNVAIIVGSYANSSTSNKPFNRLTAIDGAGEVAAVYDKLHLYDAYTWTESNTVSPAPILGNFDELGVFDLKGWRIGMLNCYDLRFPEMARGLTERGADIIAMSTAWVSGPLKDFHLSTLAAARAIETTSYLAVANQGGGHSTGRSTVVSPFGNTLSTLDLEEGIAIAVLTDEVLKSCREQLPIRLNRRYSASAQAIDSATS